MLGHVITGSINLGVSSLEPKPKVGSRLGLASKKSSNRLKELLHKLLNTLWDPKRMA
jgi:hypothetical protein